jgi:predicted O-linked N-acetylglucosamine transferase (SPINDLY family)
MATISEALAIAIQHHQGGRIQAAGQLCRRILAVEPRHSATWHLLGIIAQQAGQPAAAVDCIQRAVQFDPLTAAYHNNLGEAYRALGKLDEAVACYRRAIALNPRSVAAQNNLGVALQAQGQSDEAARCCRQALELEPDFAAGHYNLAIALQRQGNLDESQAHYRRALQLKPDFAAAWHNLGTVLGTLARHDEAAACYRRVLEIDPQDAEAGVNLANVLRDQARLDEALACCRRVLELRPELAAAHDSLGSVWKDRGQIEEALACYRRAVQLQPGLVKAHSNLLFSLHFRPGVTPAELAESHADYDRRHAAPLRSAWKPHDRGGDTDRPLRLGLVSPDFRRHPVGYFLIRVLEHLDPRQVHAICYCDRVVHDDLTARFQAAAGTWRESHLLRDEQLAGQIRADAVDVLFDLAGHTADNRLLVFARKPAPIQISWAGYVGTTGLTAMDYLLADRWQVPPEAEPYYREKVLRMPDGYVCYDPPADAPAPTPLPVLEHGQVTFGSFNNPAKISPPVVEVWSRIMRRVPRSRLVLKFRGWDVADVWRRLAGLFAAQGIDASRLEPRGWSSRGETLAEYRRVDLALDPFPYNGGLTTCEALWMGVPVMTCPGLTFAGRHALGHLSNVGLTETIASDLDQYVERTVALAHDLPRLAALRVGLREKVAASPLCDGKRFAANWMSMLQDLWEQRTNAG